MSASRRRFTTPSYDTRNSGPCRRVLSVSSSNSDGQSSTLSTVSCASAEADAQLTVLNVLDWPSEFDDETLSTRLQGPEFRVSYEGVVKRRLDALITDETRVWAAPTTVVTHGKP